MQKRFFIILLLSLTLPLSFYGQNKTKAKKFPNKLEGTWRIVEYSDWDSLAGKWKDRYGKQPRGYFIYSKSGIVSINISTDHPMKIAEAASKTMTVNYFDMYYSGSFGYFGTYKVDWEKSVVTHYVKGGSLLWYIDTEQPRPFKLAGDTLTIGDNKTTRRVLLKLD